MTKIDNYVEEVLSNIIAEDNLKKRIKGDLYLHLNEASTNANIDDVIMQMGKPKAVAREFMDSIYEDKTEIIDKLIKERTIVNKLKNDFYEFKSKINIFGVPLLHIKVNRYGRLGRRPCVAKGIIAIGTTSIGVISIGAIPIGIISLGGVALGIVSIGGGAIGLLLAVGGASIGSLAIGGVAIGFGAIGGCAIGKIAVGGYAKGTVAIGSKAVGKYYMNTNHIGDDNREAIKNLIKMAYPNLPHWISNIFTLFNVTMTNK
jgi:hypothetical protein